MSATYLVTGPTRGLGRELVRNLANRGVPMTLVLVGRPGSAMNETLAELSVHPHLELTTVECDLSSMQSVRAALTVFATDPRLAERSFDGYVGNAALQMLDARTPTVDGFETTFAIGVLANHLLLHGLRDRLAPGAHVVLVGSGTHYGELPATLLVPGPAWTDPDVLANPWTDLDSGTTRAGQRAYSTMKLGVNYLALEWRDRLSNARVNVYDPGLMPGTGLVRGGPAWRRAAWNRVMPALRILPGVTSPRHSANCLADLLTGAVFADLNGGYVEIAKRTAMSVESLDRIRSAALVASCDRLLGLTG